MRREQVHSASRFPFTGREKVWTLIRKLRRFQIDQVADESNMSRRAVLQYSTGLERAGYLRALDDGGFELIRDNGAEAPAVRYDGRPLREVLERESLWRTMKMLEDFSIVDLAIHASTEEYKISEKHARYYVNALRSAGYIVTVLRSGLGDPARYRLLPPMAKGAKPPIVMHVMKVFDPNFNKVVWEAGGGE